MQGQEKRTPLASVQNVLSQHNSKAKENKKKEGQEKNDKQQQVFPTSRFKQQAKPRLVLHQRRHSSDSEFLARDKATTERRPGLLLFTQPKEKSRPAETSDAVSLGEPDMSAPLAESNAQPVPLSLTLDDSRGLEEWQPAAPEASFGYGVTPIAACRSLSGLPGTPYGTFGAIFGIPAEERDNEFSCKVIQCPPGHYHLHLQNLLLFSRA